MDEQPVERKKRLMVHCSNGDTINIPADKLTAMEVDANYIVASYRENIIGIFDLEAIQTLYLQ